MRAVGYKPTIKEKPPSGLWAYIKREWLACLFLLAVALVLGFAIIALAWAEQTTAVILDGDTFEVAGTGERIRLAGIDAPEKSQPYGPESTDALTNLLDNGDFFLRREGRGKYGRTIGTLIYKDKSRGTTIQAALIRQGMAWVYPKYCHMPECKSWKQLERIARERKLGLWAGEKPVSPWEFRQR